jgi:cobaltochelatase CobN
MSFFKKKSKIILSILALVVLYAGYQYYDKKISPTRIAFINYSSFQLARIQKANAGKMVNVVNLDTSKLNELSRYDAVFVFGRGLELSSGQLKILKRLAWSAVPVYVESASNPNFDVTNLKGKDLDMVDDYIKFGGSDNYRNLLAYVRKELNHRRWFAPEVKRPVKIPKDVLFYLDEQQLFTDVESFKQYALKNKFHHQGKPNIALLTGVPGPFNSNRDHIDSVIVTMQRRGWNVFPVAGTSKRLTWLKQMNPDLIVLMPHGRMVTQGNEQLAGWLKTKNIPVLTALSIFQPYDRWKEDKQGYSGSLLTMNVVLPELDGAIVPYVVSAQFKDENGFTIFKAIPGRAEKFCKLIASYLRLKKDPNKNKKIAIYYFKGPGMSSLNAANLEVVPSLYNTLLRLRQEGYNVNGLPGTVKELGKLLLDNGSVLNPYAEGNISQFIQEANPALVPVEAYQQWAKQTLSPLQQNAVTEKYGPPPGSYMSTVQGGKEYLAVAKIRLGNVVLLPQPLPGIGDNSFKLVHGAKTAPPYPYLASYLWVKKEFKADAIIHFGTHGSLEFTPGKQAGLSDDDWSDALVGTTPNFYVYTMSNVGEGIMAKRRTYSTLLSHLTPPFNKSGTVNELADLEEKLHKWVNFEAGPVKVAYGKTISAAAKKAGLHIMINADEKETLNEEQLTKLASVVEEIDNETITSGLYTIGKAYTDKELNQTVRQMAINPIAYNLAKINILKGKERSDITEDQVSFTRIYRKQALALIEARLKGNETAFPLAPGDVARAESWNNSHRQTDESAIIRGFIASGKRHRPSGAPTGKPKGQVNAQQLTNLIVRIKPYPEKVQYIADLRSDKRMQEASKLLDPEVLANAKTIAEAIPKMKKAITISQDPSIRQLLVMMQDERMRQMAFKLLLDPTLVQRVTEEKNSIAAGIRKTASMPEKQSALANAKGSKWSVFQLPELITLREHLNFFVEHQELLPATEVAVAESKINQINQRILLLENREQQFANAVKALQTNFNNIEKYRNALYSSTTAELNSITNALQGGYTPVSPGGDAIVSPDALPTGRNLFSIDAEKTPSSEAWSVGKDLGQKLLKEHLRIHGKYPKKVSFTLWAGDFIKTEGAMLSEIFYLLGVEPVRDPLNRVQSLKLIPLKVLGRPRIDVVVQTSGQFRDLGASRIALINAAVAMAAAAPESANDNFVSSGVALSEQLLKKKGLSPKEARELSGLRVFGGVDGNYGTNISSMVEAGDKWSNRNEVASTYINNMGAVYGDTAHWAAFKAGLFETALQNTEIVVQPRENNTWGPLSLDHVYEFMGGLNLAVKQVTGKQPEAYFNDFRNPASARVQNVKEAIWVEAQSTILNPAYIKDMMKGGASSAETFAETLRNTYGWSVMKEDAIDQELWNSIHDVYLDDKLGLNLSEFFKAQNPYALQEMTGVLMEASRKGLWKASPAQLAKVAKLHAGLVNTYKAGCSQFVCGNLKIKATVSAYLNAEDKTTYEEKIEQAITAPTAQSGDQAVILKQQQKNEETQESSAGDRVSDESGYRYLWIALSVLVILGLVIWRKKNMQGE